jgi:23S rRNA pseudouridine1911/1915/1917 synthase
LSEPTTVYGVGPRDRGKRLDRFLHERIPGISRGRIQRAIRDRVTLTWGVRARPATPVRPGGSVVIGWTPVPEVLRLESIPVLARGEGWLAVDKPPGIPVHPVNRVRENSLIRMLRRQEGEESLRLCHRLDRETSGVLLVAHDATSARVLSGAFARGRVLKEYLALVRGRVEGESGSIDLPIARASGSKVWVRRDVAEEGEAASTSWTVERRLEGRTLLRVFPATGRRHQIRVHLAAIGHPIEGDLLYGRPDADYLALVARGEDARREGPGPDRQMLHCARLVFPTPRGADETVEAPVPLDFGRWAAAHA